MFKLIKWSAIGLVALGAAGFAIFGSHFGSYVTTIGTTVRDNFKSAIPVEVEINRAEGLIAQIEPEIKSCKLEVARAVVELRHLETTVERLEKTVTKQEAQLRKGSDYLTNAETSSYSAANRRYSRRQVELSLSHTLEMFKNNQIMLKAKRALIEKQTAAVSASKLKLDSVRTRKAELENTIAALKVQKKHLDALAASSKQFDLDDSALSQATEVLAGVKKRLDVTQQMIEEEMYFADGLKEGEAAPQRDIAREIRQHLGTANAEAKSLSVRSGR